MGSRVWGLGWVLLRPGKGLGSMGFEGRSKSKTACGSGCMKSCRVA